MRSYIITQKRGTALDVYSITKEGEVPTILMFANIDDAERYVIMLNEDDDYVVGESVHLEVTEIPLEDAVDVFNQKGHDYIFVKEDDLFIPPTT